MIRKVTVGIIIIIIAIVLVYLLNKNGFELKVENSQNQSNIPSESMSIVLSEQNGSGTQGIAVFKEMLGNLEIVIKLAGPDTQYTLSSHIHKGSCDNPGEEIYSINDIVDGESVTKLDEDMVGLSEKFPLILNVHNTVSGIDTYTACGALTR